jgi:integrase
VDFDKLIEEKSDLLVFRYRNNTQPVDLNKIFARLLREMNIEFGVNGNNRTLYSLRHTYATFELLAGTDIHTLARQMGTSIAMLEQHYSKLTATMAAEKLA